MELRQLIAELVVTRVDGPLNRTVTGLTYDSRRVTPGTVFVAIPGLTCDGHDYVTDAVARGAVAIIGERAGIAPRRATRITVPDSRLALALAAAAYYGHPSRRLRVVGITGTSGKTTVAFLLKQMLETASIRTGLISTICHQIGDRVVPAQRTTPEALEIQQMLAQMVRAGCEACVMEVSSHGADQQRVAGVHFEAGIFTNLSSDHQDYHGSMEDYFAAKRKLFSWLEPGQAVVNIDDTWGARLAGQTKAEVLLTYGLGEAAHLRAVDIRPGRTGTAMTIEGPDFSFRCRTPLLGRCNVYNALAALGGGLALKLPLSALERTLNETEPVPGRMERLGRHGLHVFVDYAHTEVALRQAMGALRDLYSGRLLVVFGCGGSRDWEKRARMGRAAAELADLTFITTDNPRRESPVSIAAQILDGYRTVRSDGCVIELDRRRAIQAAVQNARPGDTILIAGKGHETYQESADTVVPFDDRAEALDALESRPLVMPVPQPRRQPVADYAPV